MENEQPKLSEFEKDQKHKPPKEEPGIHLGGPDHNKQKKFTFSFWYFFIFLMLLYLINSMKLGPDVDLHKIAQGAAGLAGADLANIANEAALMAVRQKRDTIAQVDFEEAIEKSVAGLERKSRVMNPEERKRVAYHDMITIACPNCHREQVVKAYTMIDLSAEPGMLRCRFVGDRTWAGDSRRLKYRRHGYHRPNHRTFHRTHPRSVDVSCGWRHHSDQRGFLRSGSGLVWRAQRLHLHSHHAIQRRILTLESLYGNNPAECVLEDIPKNNVVGQEWVELPYYSSRQHSLMQLGGVKGGIEVQGSVPGKLMGLLMSRSTVYPVVRMMGNCIRNRSCALKNQSLFSCLSKKNMPLVVR